MLIYELLVLILGIVISMIILNYNLPKIELDQDQIEFKYYYSSCLNKTYGNVYSVRYEKLIRIYSKEIFIIEYEDC